MTVVFIILNRNERVWLRKYNHAISVLYKKGNLLINFQT